MDLFVENINLAVENVEDLDFNIYTKKVEEQISGFADVIEKKLIKSNNQKYYRIVFGLVQNNMNLKIIQHYYPYKNRIYALTFTSESKEFKKYVNDINDSFSSFKIN